MGEYTKDLLDLSRADITSKRPGQRQRILHGISALEERALLLAEADAKLPPLPPGVGNAIMEAFELSPSRVVGELRRLLERGIESGELEARREDAYYVHHLAKFALVPDASEERNQLLVSQSGYIDPALAREADIAADADVDLSTIPEFHDADPDAPQGIVSVCGSDHHH